MGVRGGGGARGSACLTHWPAKNSMFLDFFEKNSMFLGVFRQKVCFCPPWKILPPRPPWKKARGRPWLLQKNGCHIVKLPFSCPNYWYEYHLWDKPDLCYLCWSLPGMEILPLKGFSWSHFPKCRWDMKICVKLKLRDPDIRLSLV
jgi:hypothetical protein